MKKILVFGTGECFKKNKKEIEKRYNVIGFLDNYFKGEYFENKKIFALNQINKIEYDLILICSMYVPEIVKELISQGIDKEKIDIGIELDENIKELLKIKKAKFVIEGDIVVFYREKEKLEIRNTNNLYVVKETFLWEEYNYKIDEKHIVVDIGANIGDTAIYFAKKDKVEKVIAFEPFYETYMEAKKNIENNEHLKKKIELNNFGISNEARKIKVGYSQNISGNMSSIEEKSNNNLEKNVEIKLKGVVDVFKKITQENKNKKIFVKIDCEGAEFEIFEGIKENIEIVENIVGFIIEWHYDNPNKILDILVKNKFKVVCKNSLYSVGMIYAFK